jgi:Poxvirus A32 protein
MAAVNEPSANRISVKKFDMEKLTKKHFTMVLTGKRGSGKSYLTKDIMFHLHKANFPRCVVFSQTEAANGFFGDFVPGLFIHSPLDLNVLANILKQQKELILKHKLGQLPANQDTRLLIVLDDCAYDKRILGSPTIREVFMNGRHYHLSLIVTLQYLVDLQPSLRANVDVAFFLKENIRCNKERIYKHFAGFYPDFRVFEAVFDACTANFEAFCIDNTISSTNNEEIASYYKASHREFKFGHPKLWKFHDRFFLSEEEEFVMRQNIAVQHAVQQSVTKVTNCGTITVVRE